MNNSKEEKQTFETVSQDLFNRAWSVYTEMGIEERHFNSLQSTYRTLASTWLLASFAAIGFVLSEKFIGCPFDKLLVVVAIGLMANIGIILIWNLDLNVYHPLLASAYRQGLNLEKTYPWLPQMRVNMMERMNNRGVVPRVVWFYIIGSTIPLTISGITFVSWGITNDIRCTWLGGVLFLVLVPSVGKFIHHCNEIEHHMLHEKRAKS